MSEPINFCRAGKPMATKHTVQMLEARTRTLAVLCQDYPQTCLIYVKCLSARELTPSRAATAMAAFMLSRHQQPLSHQSIST